MPFELRSIKGIGVETEKKLVSEKIEDVNMLRSATQTPEERKELASKISVSKDNLYLWSKQVELMKVEGITANDAEILVQSGIRDVEDLKDVNSTGLLSFIKTIMSNRIDAKRVPTLEEINLWKKNAESVSTGFKRDENDKKNEYIFLPHDEDLKIKDFVKPETKEEKTRESEFFSDLSDVIIEIGAGIAGAQHEMDLSSIDIQNTILENEDLAAYGLNATWYTIPEVNFDLKMEYTMVEESSKSGSGSPIRKIFVSPSNAKYNNYFKTSKTEESTLSLRFVPLPPPEGFTERIVMPDLIGMSKEEAEEELDLNGISIKNIEIINGKTNNNKSSEVTYQSIQPGKIVLINQKPELKIILNDS